MRYRGLADRYSTLSLLSPVGVFLTDANGTINCRETSSAVSVAVALTRSLADGNPRFYEITGHSGSGDVPLSEWSKSVHPEDQERLERAKQEAVRIGPFRDGKQQSTTMELRLIKNGEVVWVQWEVRTVSFDLMRRSARVTHLLRL